MYKFNIDHKINDFVNRIQYIRQKQQLLKMTEKYDGEI